MARKTFEAAMPDVRAFMGAYNLHHGRFTDDAALRFYSAFQYLRDERGRAKATQFFVIGEREMDWRRKRPVCIRDGNGQSGADEPFHVARAAAIKLSVPA
jgi:hypothetical protein